MGLSTFSRSSAFQASTRTVILGTPHISNPARVCKQGFVDYREIPGTFKQKNNTLRSLCCGLIFTVSMLSSTQLLS